MCNSIVLCSDGVQVINRDLPAARQQSPSFRYAAQNSPLHTKYGIEGPRERHEGSFPHPGWPLRLAGTKPILS